jgi:hypothetical protein
VPIKTVYITGVKGKQAAQAAAMKRLEEEKGSSWTQVVDSVEAEEEPNGIKKETE